MNELQVIGIDEKGYGKVYKVVMRNPDVSLSAKALYAYFCSYAGSGTSAFPHREKIINDLDITKNTFTKHLNNLVGSQYIARKRTAMGNIYEILLLVPNKDGEMVEAKSMGYGTIPKFAMLDNRLTVNAKGIYAYLCSYAGAGNIAYPRRSTILRELAISEGKYYRHFNKLVELGYVTPEQGFGERGRYKSSTYTLNEVLGIDPRIDPDKIASESHSQKRGYGDSTAFNTVFNGHSQKQRYGEKAMSQKPMYGKTVHPKLGHANINNSSYNKQSSFIKEDNISNIPAHGDDNNTFPSSRDEVKSLINYSLLLRELDSWAGIKDTIGHFAFPSERAGYVASGRKVVDEIVYQLLLFFKRSSDYFKADNCFLDSNKLKQTLRDKVSDTDFMSDRVFSITDSLSEIRALRPYIKQLLINLVVESTS